jgi:hypothetical protein
MSEERLVALIRAHLERYPGAQIADVYKLLHQGVFGPGHAIVSKKATREWLEHEASQQTPAADEMLIESVHPDGLMVRVHLRPYLAHRGSLSALLDAFVRSAEQVRGDPDTMARWWNLFQALCAQGELCSQVCEQREAILFGRVRARENWPAVHHSPAYCQAYRPAYRVLTAGEAEALCRKLRIPFVVR